jgi:hypothetical protein
MKPLAYSIGSLFIDIDPDIYDNIVTSVIKSSTFPKDFSDMYSWIENTQCKVVTKIHKHIVAQLKIAFKHIEICDVQDVISDNILMSDTEVWDLFVEMFFRNVKPPKDCNIHVFADLNEIFRNMDVSSQRKALPEWMTFLEISENELTPLIISEDHTHKWNITNPSKIKRIRDIMNEKD